MSRRNFTAFPDSLVWTGLDFSPHYEESSIQLCFVPSFVLFSFMSLQAVAFGPFRSIDRLLPQNCFRKSPPKRRVVHHWTITGQGMWQFNSTNAGLLACHWVKHIVSTSWKTHGLRIEEVLASQKKV